MIFCELYDDDDVRISEWVRSSICDPVTFNSSPSRQGYMRRCLLSLESFPRTNVNPFGMVVSQDDDGALGTALNGMTVRKVDRPEGCGFIS